MKFQKKVYEYIAGILSKVDLEQAIENAKGKSWIENVWIPNLEDVVTDKKLLYSPLPNFETTKQSVLILQGTLDEIIPENSHEIISNALTKAGNTQYKTILLDSASHAMNFVGKSDFPYWSKLHPDYLNTIEKWLSSVDN